MEELNKIAQKVHWSNSTQKETFGDPINYTSFDDFIGTMSQNAKAGISVAGSLREFCIVAVNERVEELQKELNKYVNDYVNAEEQMKELQKENEGLRRTIESVRSTNRY